MKRYAIALLLAVCALTASAREVYNINRDWKFFYGNEVSSDNAPRINLPHMWNNDALGGQKDYLRGIGNYLKEIEIPASWQGKRVFIKCHGANSITNVHINGKHVGEHRGGYTAFACEITDYVNFGKVNYLWIMVNNSPQTDVLPIAGDANQYGGLFRDVEIVVTEAEAVSLLDNGSQGLYIKQRSVTAQKVEAEAVVRVDGRGSAEVTAVLELRDATGKVVASGSAKAKLSGRDITTANIPFAIENPSLWNGTKNPYLYTASVAILRGGKQTDRVEVKTGFRAFSVDRQRGFVLNGNPYPVRGVVVTQDRAMMGNALTKYQIEEDFELIRGMGANAVRVMGVCHNPYFYELCDKAGILVWNDFPLVGAAYLTDKSFIDSRSFRANGEQQAREIIRQRYNNPSVVMWGIFSDFSFRGDNPVVYIGELNALAKKEDPSRMTVASSNEDGKINFITDLIVWNQHLGWREGMPSDMSIWIKMMKDEWGGIRSGISYAAGASIFHQDDALVRPFMNGNWHPERWQTHFHEEYFSRVGGDPFFWSVFVGNMFDYGAAGRTWGENNGINDCGLVTFDRKYCKDAYFLYKANWNTDDLFVYIAERRWNIRGGRKQDIRVYSNCPEVELFVNGESRGIVKPNHGVCLWKDTELSDGSNTIEAHAVDIHDSAEIVIQKTPGVL